MNTKKQAAACPVDTWYCDAEDLIKRTRSVIWLPNNLNHLHRIQQPVDSTPEQDRELDRQATKALQAAIDDAEKHLWQLETDTTELAARFDTSWIDLFYFELRNISIDRLPGGRCALVPIQHLVWSVRNWTNELITLAKLGRRLCRYEHDSKYQEQVAWVNQSADALRERLLLERLLIKKTVAIPSQPATVKSTKETLKAARIETLRKFLADAKTYQAYVTWKGKNQARTLHQYATRLNILGIKQLQSRCNQRTHQGWTVENVTAELKRKQNSNDS